MWAPALAAAVSIASAVAARDVAGPGFRAGAGATGTAPVTARWFASAAAATEAALESRPVLVAFGELHQTDATRDVPSALARFTDAILPAIAPGLSHLVVETWVVDGRCGDDARAVAADVARTTERPAGTTNEIETLIRAAARAGVRPRILSIGCADYQAMRPAGTEVDYDRVLKVTARALVDAGRRALAERAAIHAGGETVRPAMAIYGGALHNDVAPSIDLAPYSFARELAAATLGHLVEIDLIVPEYAARSPGVTDQPWWRAHLKARRASGVVLVRRGPRSFAIVFPRSSLRSSPLKQALP